MVRMLKKGPEKEPIGVGLSAVQVGKPTRLFMALSPSEKKYRFFINPKIVKEATKLTTGVPESKNKFEGCLSVPEVYGIVKRPQWVKMTYQTLKGDTKTEKFAGFLATVIQHEYDHLEGILFTDRILEQKGKIYKLGEGPNKKELVEIKLDQ